MKKIIKKTYAIILILMMLMNYFTVIVNAAEGFDSSSQYAILALDSEKREYNTGDDIFIDVEISEVNILSISDVTDFFGKIRYEDKLLEFQEFEFVNCINSGSASGVSFQVVANNDATKKFKLNDAILRMKFKALEAPLNTQTTISIIAAQVTGNDVSCLQEDGAVNIPEITLTLNPELKHNLQITKTDASSNAITENSALFKITKLDGQVVYRETDENGIITLTNLEKPTTEAPYIYTIEEILAPTGYIKSENPIQLTVTFDDAGNIQTLLSSENGIASVIGQNNTIDLKVLNTAQEPEVEKEVFNLVINKVDEENNSITTSPAEFALTMPDGTKENYTTNSEGKTQNIAILAPEEAGTYTYLIKETKAPEGYMVEESNIIVEFTYEKQENKIVLASGKVVSYNNEAITIESGDVRTARVNIKNEKELVTYNYRVNIDKAKNDTFKTNITEDTAIFEITENGKTQYVKTNQLGKATYEFSKTNKEIAQSQEYIYTIKEVKAPNGYVLDETQKTITITFNNDGTINTYEISGTKIEKINNTTSEVNVRVINEKEPEVIPSVPQDFELQINKVTPEGEPITAETKYTVTLPNGEQKEYSTTGADKILPVPEKAGTYVYVLTETKTPAGYIKGNDIVLKLTFEEIDGKIVLVSGNNGVEVTGGEDIKIATLNVETQKEPITPENYTIKISGVDRENNQIENGTTIIKLTNKEAGTYEYKEVQIKDGEIELQLPKVEGTINYELEQIKAPDGYKANTESAQVTITFTKDENEKIVVNNYTVTGEDVTKGTSTDKNIVSLIITNDKIEVEPQKQKYSIEINKLDSVTKELITQGSAIFTIVDPNGTIKEYATTSGTISINEILPGNVGESYTFIIKEKVAPEGYKLTSETIIIKLSFNEVEGKVVVIESQIIMGSSVATTQKTQEGNIKIDITNEKEEVEKEKLYVVSRKYKNNDYIFYDEYLGRINEKYPIYEENEDIYQVLDYFYGVYGDNGRMKGKKLTPVAYTIDKPFIDTKIAKYENKNVFVEEFIGNLESNGHMVVLDQNGNELGPRDIVATGMILRSTLDDQQLTFDIVVKGDGYKAPNEKKAGRVNTGDKNALTKYIAGDREYVTNPLSLRALDIDMDGRLNTSDKAEITEILAYTESSTQSLPYHVKWSNSNILLNKANIQYVKP
ncbi:MAG: hypothetical protein HFJ41_04200 [Clostridia bacterium]|nr:hypothetical protein [Clostridia bacterium]